VTLFDLLILTGALVSFGVGSSTKGVLGVFFFLTWILVQVSLYQLSYNSAKSSAKGIMKTSCTGVEFVSLYRAIQYPTLFSIRKIRHFHIYKWWLRSRVLKSQSRRGSPRAGTSGRILLKISPGIRAAYP